MHDDRPKKLVNMYIYEILKNNTDVEHTMTQKQIQDMLESKYEMKIDRKAVKANLDDISARPEFKIEHKTTKIRYTPNPKTGEIEESELWSDYYYDSEFDDSQLRLLMDSVLFSKNIPSHNKKEMLEKLKTLSNKYFKFSTGNIQSYESADRQINQNIFLAIQVIDEAINENKQVKFKYVEYGIDKKLHPRTDSQGKPREYIINPYTMVATAGKYYVLCNNDKFDNIANYRIDRIIDVEKLETPCKDKHEVKGLVGLNVPSYMQEHIYMFSGKSIRAKFEMPSYLISDVLDYFRANVDFNDIGNDKIVASVKANETDIQMWARQYSGQIKVLEPTELAEACKQDLIDALALYEE